MAGWMLLIWRAGLLQGFTHCENSSRQARPGLQAVSPHWHLSSLNTATSELGVQGDRVVVVVLVVVVVVVVVVGLIHCSFSS